MGQLSEIKYSLGFNILLPRLCFFVLLPCLILVLVPAPPAFPLLLVALQPVYATAVLAGSFLLFGLSVVANLNISRYLRLHQTPDSPYAYEANYDPSRRSVYFRIQVADKVAFRRLLHDIRREHPRESIRFWFLLADLLWVPPLLVMLSFLAVFMLIPWLIKCAWVALKGRQPHPAP